ncbi:hypothetical protein [Collimonas humicola]|uniref:hypothetical protein n=1 Tax=Collimonas humicola TaxID=2825886 RepID=UPI001B8BC908|nr:hypothetical protein [Collimonas humicola]
MLPLYNIFGDYVNKHAWQRIDYHPLVFSMMVESNVAPRKEDMFFDRDEEDREILRDALRRAIPASLLSRPCACWRIGWLRNLRRSKFSAIPLKP